MVTQIIKRDVSSLLSQKNEPMCAYFEHLDFENIIISGNFSNSAHCFILFKCTFFQLTTMFNVITHDSVPKLHKYFHNHRSFHSITCTNYSNKNSCAIQCKILILIKTAKLHIINVVNIHKQRYRVRDNSKNRS